MGMDWTHIEMLLFILRSMKPVDSFTALFSKNILIALPHCCQRSVITCIMLSLVMTHNDNYSHAQFLIEELQCELCAAFI